MTYLVTTVNLRMICKDITLTYSNKMSEHQIHRKYLLKILEIKDRLLA